MGLYIGNTIVATKKAKTQIMYTCSKCDRYNQFTYEAVGEGKIFSMANPHGKKSKQLCEKACAIADKNLESKLRAFEENLEKGRYENIDLEHTCTHCGHIEPWVYVRTDDIGKYAFTGVLLSIAMIVAGAVTLLVKPVFGGAFMATGAIVGIVADSVYTTIKTMRIKKACADLPVSAKPRIREYL